MNYTVSGSAVVSQSIVLAPSTQVLTKVLMSSGTLAMPFEFVLISFSSPWQCTFYRVCCFRKVLFHKGPRVKASGDALARLAKNSPLGFGHPHGADLETINPKRRIYMMRYTDVILTLSYRVNVIHCIHVQCTLYNIVQLQCRSTLYMYTVDIYMYAHNLFISIWFLI